VSGGEYASLALAVAHGPSAAGRRRDVVTTYQLKWNGNDHTFTLSEARAAEIVSEWSRHGVVTGDLASGRVDFMSTHGGNATLKEIGR
jgi:hypothetical protein